MRNPKLLATFLMMAVLLVPQGLRAAEQEPSSLLEQIREQRALYSQQATDLASQAQLSQQGLFQAQAELAKQQLEVQAANAKLQGIQGRLIELKERRATAMLESYMGSDQDSYLLALLKSGTISEFMRKSTYMDFVLTKRVSALQALDDIIADLDSARNDVITKKNAYETQAKLLQRRISEIQTALSQNKSNDAAAKQLEDYLASRVGIFTSGGCRSFPDEASGSSITMQGGGTEHGLGMSQYGAKGAADHGHNYVKILTHYYRGTEIGNVGSFDTNQGESERYLVGVVEAEMSSNWPMEALKAQAVAARGYAYKNRYGLDNTPRTQAWVGPSLQTDRARQAVAETRGQVLMYGGQVISAYYHSTSGGCTEDNENVWGGTPLPYIRAANSPWETDSPHWSWHTATYSKAELSGIFSRDSRTAVGNLQSIRVIGRGSGGRVTSVQLIGSSGSKTVSGPTFKSVFNSYSPASERGLRSTLFGFAS